MTKEEILSTVEPQSIGIIVGPNSWSENWADKGMYYFTDDFIPYVKELIVFIPPATNSYQFNNVMYFGQTSADIHALQGILGVPQTGFYWFTTVAAVRAYQLAHNLKTGSMGFVVQQDMIASLNS